MSFIFLLFGMTCFGISNCLWRNLQSKYNNPEILFYRSVITITLLSAIIYIFNIKTFNHINQAILAYRYASPSILISLVGLLLFIESLKKQASGISGAVILWSILFGIILSYYFDSITLPRKFWTISILYISGLVLIDKDLLNIKLPTQGTILALGAGLCWAIANRGFKSGISLSNPTTYALFQEITVLIISAILLFRTSRKEQSISNNFLVKSKNVLLLAVLTVGGIMGSNFALYNSNIIYFTLISAVQPATTVFISKYIQKEKISNQQILGAMVLIIGAMMV